MNKPDPLTPPDSDLRDFQFMPLDVVRFAQSDLVSMEDAEAVLAALLLWGAAWHSTPAGSLTDDDRVLAKAAGYGRAIGDWQRIRTAALHGFIKCSDGRLYHPVVSEKVVEAWNGKLRQRHRTYCAAVRKHNERDKEKVDQRQSPSFEDWLDGGRPQAVVTPSAPSMSRVTGDHVARDEASQERDTPSLSRSSHAEIASKGQGQGQGQGDINYGTSSLPVEPAAPSDGSAGRDLVLVSPEPAPTRKARAKAEPTAAEQKLFDEFWAIYPRRVAKQPALEAYLVVVRRGVDPQAILQGLRAYASSRLGKDPEKTAHAATWLNAGRWTDEIEAPPPGGYNDNRPGGGWDPMQQAIDGMDFNRDDAA